jgi:NTP pyrophosphatase (non-canonical NTP hydrolase)
MKSKDMELIEAELTRAVEKFPDWPTDPLHAVAILGEEFGELTKAVLETTYEPHKSSILDVHKEAIQTAAMALRFVASLNAYVYNRSHWHSQNPNPELCVCGRPLGSHSHPELMKP